MTTKSLLHSSEGFTIFNGSTVSFISLIAGLLALSLSGYVVADEQQKKLPVIQFSIKPRLCVLSAGEEVCRDELEITWARSEEHTSELQSRENLVCRLLLEKKKRKSEQAHS